ncbi:hypothetical protein XENTR_v10005601 [Xenopus tropicalis]|nr:hypothetical protein XENTR_v10005601 [Xenopus tropicalis]
MFLMWGLCLMPVACKILPGDHQVLAISHFLIVPNISVSVIGASKMSRSCTESFWRPAKKEGGGEGEAVPVISIDGKLYIIARH